MAIKFIFQDKILYTLLIYVLCSCFPCNAQHIFPDGVSLNRTLLELPCISEDDTIVIHQGYIASYNSRYMLPNWVAYELTIEELQGAIQRKGSFKKDPYLPIKQATNGDYLKSGFDKGHMAPAADMKWSEVAMEESFFFSNICPQTPMLNRNNWLNLENLTRIAASKYGKVWTISGAIVKEEYRVIGTNNVAVPEMFYKAILAYNGQQYVSAAFIMKNDDEIQPISEVIMSVDDLELLINIDLFASLTEVDSICESEVYLSDWNLYE